MTDLPARFSVVRNDALGAYHDLVGRYGIVDSEHPGMGVFCSGIATRAHADEIANEYNKIPPYRTPDETKDLYARADALGLRYKPGFDDAELAHRVECGPCNDIGQYHHPMYQNIGFPCAGCASCQPEGDGA